MGDSALVCKSLYQKLLSINSSPPILPRQWSQVIGPGFSLDGHWSLVRDPFTENYKNDVFWLIILRGVKVRDSLFNWGCISSGRCASCPRRETIDHCFLNCLRVKRVWLHFVPVLSLLLGRQFVANLLTVFFFRWPSLSAKRARLARHLTTKFILIKSPDEWATTKQACRDELVVYLSFSSIYTTVYFYVLSTVLRKSSFTLYIYIYIYI